MERIQVGARRKQLSAGGITVKSMKEATLNRTNLVEEVALAKRNLR